VADIAALAFVEGPPVEPIDGLPDAVAAAVDGASWSSVRGGLSDARVDVLRWPDGRHAFLKSGAGPASDPEAPAGRLSVEHDRLLGFAGALPVPEVLAWSPGTDAPGATGAAHLLTTPVPGTPATDPDNHQDPDALILALAAGLRRVHDLPVAGIGGPRGVDPRVERARARVQRGLVDRRDFEPAYARFTPERLVELLEDARPSGPEDLVVVHGDPSLANLLLGPSEGGELAILGYVDVDRAGVADRYLDLAIIARSLASNLSPEALGPFFHAYGIEAPDLLKVDFYVLLDEFS
jgi:aminoglycoside phosphotransferase